MVSYIPIRRYVNADNSCLFSTIAYLIDKDNFNENSGLIYRIMIVDYIKDNEISNDILGMEKDEYIKKISEQTTWGGAIELKLFSDIYQIEIASLDVQSGRIDIFGETNDYDRRIYILYNGIHYDPLVMNTNENADTKEDITIFSPYDDNKLVIFKDYVEDIKSTGDFVDLSNINNYKCNMCNEEYQCEEDAMIHGQTTDHWSFTQI